MYIDPLPVLRDLITLRYRTQLAAARHWEVSPAFVSSVLSGKKAPTEQMLAEAGLERLLVYRWTNAALRQAQQDQVRALQDDSH